MKGLVPQRAIAGSNPVWSTGSRQAMPDFPATPEAGTGILQGRAQAVRFRRRPSAMATAGRCWPCDGGFA